MISEELQKKIDVLPRSVSDYLGSDEIIDAVIDLNEEFGLTHEQVVVINDVIYGTFVRDIKIEDVFDRIRQGLGLDAEKTKSISLVLLREIFYRLKDFFPGIDDEILRLGGEIPRGGVQTIAEQLNKREAEIEEMQKKEEEEEAARMADTTVYDDIESLMSQFPEAGEMIIGTQKAISVKTMSIEMKPMIKYWIRDYKEKMGYHQHSNLDRVQYVCHDKNTRNMNEEERYQLNMVLKSLDENIKLPYSTRRKKIDFSLIANK